MERSIEDDPDVSNVASRVPKSATLKGCGSSRVESPARLIASTPRLESADPLTPDRDCVADLSGFCCFFGVRLGAALRSRDFCVDTEAEDASDFSSAITFGAIGFRGPSGRGAEYFLGPLGPRLSGFSGLFAIFPSAGVSTKWAIEETLISA